MKQRLGVIVGVIAAFLVGSFAISGSATAAGDAGSSATKLEKSVKKAEKKAKSTCKKVKKAKGKAKAKAKKRCKSAKKNAKKQRAKLKTYNAQFFDVCKHGCKYRTIQKGVDAAGKWKNAKKNSKRNATVRVQPGTYKEGVLVDGRRAGYNFVNLTIMGVTKAKTPNKNARAVILEGEGALTDMTASALYQPGDPATQTAQNAIEGTSTTGLKMKNMWARHYQNNTFFVHASNVEADGERCSDYVMDNLVSSDTRAYGLFARNCFGGQIINSEGWGHGDSTVYIGETPCDSYTWSNKDDVNEPCQANPKWTIVKNVKAWGNPLGYSGTNSKYVKITDSKWFNNGAGIVPNTLDSEKFEPTGDLIIENNDIMWNNYNYYQPGAGYNNVIGNANPIGVGVMLYGSDGVTVKNNNIFGHEKWGAATFSGPELFGVNKGDDAKNLNNHFIDNKMGLNGQDKNAIDFFTDNSGGGNCWSGNTAAGNPTFAPGNGSVPISEIYPSTCPTTEVLWKDATAHELGAGLQVNTAYISPEEPWRDLSTIFGVATLEPPKDDASADPATKPNANQCDGVGYFNPLCNLTPRESISGLQECAMTLATHPPYTVDGVTYESKSAPRVTAEQCAALAAL